MLIIGAAALIFFGPDQLPKVAKRAGQVVREVQNTSQSFIREMERAADEAEVRERASTVAPVTPQVTPEEAPHVVPSELEHTELHGASGAEVNPSAARSGSYEI